MLYRSRNETRDKKTHSPAFSNENLVPLRYIKFGGQHTAPK